MEINKIYQGDSLQVLKTLPSESIDCVITSPPYWQLRDYDVDGQLGLEENFFEYINKLCDIFDEIKRILKKDGTCFVNIADTYSGKKKGKTDDKVFSYLKENSQKINKKSIIQEKCLCQIPSRFAIEMTNRGWILRNRLIWHKPNAMPSSASDRFTVDYEDIFFFVKNKKYYFDNKATQEQAISNNKIKDLGTRGKQGYSKAHGGGRDSSGGLGYSEEGKRKKRSVWTINTKPFSEAHFATFPEKLIEPMIKAGCPEGGIILDPFMGSGTTAVVARKLDRKYIGIELNEKYCKIAQDRLRQEMLF